MKDARGAEVSVGDRVVYFVSRSSSLGFRVGEVLELTTRKSYPHPEEVARVQVTAGRYMWSGTGKPRLVAGVNLLVVTGLPDVEGD